MIQIGIYLEYSSTPRCGEISNGVSVARRKENLIGVLENFLTRSFSLRNAFSVIIFSGLTIKIETDAFYILIGAREHVV